MSRKCILLLLPPHQVCSELPTMSADSALLRPPLVQIRCARFLWVTFVINTQGPGPFTFNINLTGLPSTDAGLNEFRCQYEPGPNPAYTANQSTGCAPSIYLYPSPIATILAATPGPTYQWPIYSPPLLPHKEEAISQAVQAPDTPQNSMPSSSATEDSDDYKDDQLPATFSPHCQVCSRTSSYSGHTISKAGFERMERDVMTGTAPSPKRRQIG
ncbi:hypothetical protein B0H12DRAFT_1140799 [Mycena haematopus]|nr:hypothetical protein B0H12DRAFT_1140799 [Mycena haematopus]